MTKPVSNAAKRAAKRIAMCLAIHPNEKAIIVGKLLNWSDHFAAIIDEEFHKEAEREQPAK